MTSGAGWRTVPGMRLARVLAVLLLPLLSCGCGGPSSHRGDPPAPPAAVANDVLFRALGLVGTPYRYGGNTPASGFDCSGLVGFVFREAAGLSLPRSSREIARLDAKDVARHRLAPGDLVFFGRGNGVSHIGIFVGEGRFVHAPASGGTVRLDALDGPYWREHFLYARRILE